MIAGIILAAGASSRMGSPKALLDYRGETFLDRLIRVVSTVCDPVIVALGHHEATIRARVRSRAQFVVNPDPERGQLSSLQTALAVVPPEAAGFMFVPVDCPAVEPRTVSRLVSEFVESGALVAIPRYDGSRGHPVCVSQSLIAELLALPPTSQARDVIRAHAERTHYVDVDDAGVLADIDDPAAYQRLASQSK